MRGQWRRRVRWRGQALVEAALAIVPVLMLAIGLLEFALYLYAWHILDAAVLEGARVASAQGRGLDDGRAYAQTLVRGALNPAGYLDEPSIDGTTDSEWVIIEGRSAFHVVVPLLPDTRLPLQARATMRKEQFRPGGRAP